MNDPIIDVKNSNSKQIESNNHLVKRVQELSSTIEELNELCKNLDPYQPINDEMKKSLSSYGIFEIDDPFLITNKLVLILENSVEELISLGGTP